MTNVRMKTTTLLAMALAASLLAPPALAEKPAHAGGGKPDRHQAGPGDRSAGTKVERRNGSARNDQQSIEQRERRPDGDRRDTRSDNRGRDGDYRGGRDGAPRSGAYFTDSHREVVRSYYGESYRAGRCPPGLAKKRNGCMPPGLAKQWRIGQPLPRNVVYYDAPRDIVLRFGMPPEGYRYVRVAADILLIAVGTGMVIDALEDLSRM
jgi:Ni/Co efflux regulator RcnB